MASTRSRVRFSWYVLSTCIIGAVPVLGVFIFVGTAATFLYLIALCSIARVRQAIGTIGWRLLQIVGMNFIAFAFAVDFFRMSDGFSLKYAVSYLPFAVLSVAAPILVFVSLALRAARAEGPFLSGLFPGHCRHGG